MGSDLTAGFDIAAVLSEECVSRVFQMSYMLGAWPTRASDTFTHEGRELDVELFLLLPTLELSDLALNAVKMTFPFIVQVPGLDAQGTGAVSAFATAKKDSVIVEDNTEIEFVVVDFAGVPAEQLTFSPHPSPSLPGHVAFGSLAPELVEHVGGRLAAERLAATLPRVPLTPEISSGFGFFDFRSHVDADFVLPEEGTPYDLPRTVGAYVNRSLDSRQPPEDPPIALRQHIQPHPHQASYIWAGADEMKVALPADLVMDSLAEARVEMGLDPDSLPAELPDEPSVLINSLDVTLKGGFLDVRGNATKVVDGGPDADVDFILHVELSVSNGHLQTKVVHKEFDLPWWLDALPFFLPIGGSMLLHMIHLTVAGETGSIGGLAGDFLSGLSVFTTRLPGSDVASVSVTNDGDIEITPEGLVLPGQISSLVPLTDASLGDYVYAHVTSHQFHRAGQGCPFLPKLKRQNTLLYLSPAAAINAGNLGCRACAFEFDEEPAGRLLVHLRHPGPASPATLDVKLDFELLEAKRVLDMEIKPKFERHVKYEAIPDAGGAARYSDEDARGLLAGRWRVGATAGEWSTSCEVDVGAWGEFAGNRVELAFTIGADGCGVGVGETPAFP